MRKSTALLLFVMLFALSSCFEVKSQESTESSDIKATLSISTIGITPSVTFTKETTTFTPVPTNTAIPTKNPTLSDEDRQLTIENLIKTNAGCQLPCFWGIMPGVTTKEESMSILFPLRAKTENETTNLVFTQVSSNATSNQARSVVTIFSVFYKNEIVDYNRIKSLSNDGLLPDDSLVKFYSPKNFLEANGIPTRVMLQSNAEKMGNTGNQGYSLWVFYDQKGMLMRYDGFVKYSAVYHYCPKFGINGELSQFSLILTSPGRKTIENQDEVWSSGFLNILDIQTATGMTLNEFVDIFWREDSSGCFNVAKEKWEK